MTNEELVAALRRLSTAQDTDNSLDWVYGSQQAMHDAADAIEELQAEVESMDESCKKQLVAMASHVADLQAEVERLEPKQRKLGRWEKAKPKGVVVYSDGYAECSSCHEVIWLGWGMNFCPHCGEQNRIIDPDDMAKMEVQDG